MNAKRISKWFVYGGLLLIAAALCLTMYNINEQLQASYSTSYVLQQFSKHTDSVENKTDKNTDKISESAQKLPEYITNPNMEMPTLEMDGQNYIGILSIPALELNLPIIGEWSYPNLKIAPCRYKGSVYLNNMILMAHNYAGHFGSLPNLKIGDEVYFEDMNGNIFHYEAVEMETVAGEAVEDMLSGDWDLSLFTCNVSGTSRITVRCKEVIS